MYVFIEPLNFSFFSITGWGIDLDYCDVEWFALESNRDHSVIFEIASKYWAERSNLTSKERWMHGRRRAERSYSTFKVRRGFHEEITFFQSKEQQLRFAGAAVKRYHTSKVRETQARQ